MRALVFGTTGQVARELARLAPARGIRLTALGRAEADLTDPDACARAVRLHDADVVVNAAAYTAVDKAEEQRLDAARLGGAGELAGHLPGLAEDQGPHQALACFRPSRSSLWPRAWIACHQSRLSRYQRTVRRSPSSSVTDGAQPSSSRILPESIA